MSTVDRSVRPTPETKAGPAGPQLHVERVTKRFGALTAVDDVTVEVLTGEFLAILGPSGSGKTTIMRIIGGFVRPDAGRVSIRGRDVTDLPPNRRDVNTVFQSYALFPHMTVEQNVAYGLKVNRVPRAERLSRVRQALELVRLQQSGRSRPAELSGGMQQRVALARALVNRPGVLLLDEPLGALDRKLREDMQVELRRLQMDLGITFVYVTHDQEEALGMSDRLAVMRDGRIEQIGTPTAVYDDPVSLWVAGFVGSSNRLVGIVKGSSDDVVELETDSGRIRATRAHAHGDVRVGSRATAVVRPEHVETSEHAPSPSANTVRAYVQEVLNLGGYVKVVASTAGGLELLARRQRDGSAVDDARPGDQLWFCWPPTLTHVYGTTDQPA